MRGSGRKFFLAHHTELTCAYCGKDFYRKNGDIVKGAKNSFCCRDHSNRFQSESRRVLISGSITVTLNSTKVRFEKFSRIDQLKVMLKEIESEFPGSQATVKFNEDA